MKVRLAIFASGNGTNAHVLLNYFSNHPTIEIGLIVTNNEQAGVLTIAQTFAVETIIFDNNAFTHGEQVLQCLINKQIDFIILSGFLRKIPEKLITAFDRKIINIHPALLPKFGGKGMYGKFVHEAVYQANEKESGITIHLVNQEFDKGAHLAKYTCKLTPTDNPESIASKVQQLEHEYFAPTIERYILSLY